MPSADTPLYNHPLPELETWLRDSGCQQDRQELNHWWVEKANWKAQLWLETDRLTVVYEMDDSEIQRSFKYSLSRQDVEDAVFGGP